MIITIVAALDKNSLIGTTTGLPWYLPADLKHFKEVTTGHVIVMGRKTYETIGRSLPNRTNVVITRNVEFDAPGCMVLPTIESALDRYKDEQEIYIIGGAQIYQEAMPYATHLSLTKIDQAFDGNVYFPKVDWNAWEEIGRVDHQADEKNPYNYSFVAYERKPLI